MAVSRSKLKIILRTLKELYPVVKTQLDHGDAFQLLIATILSAQCTDRQVNLVTQKLFACYPDPQALADAPLNKLKQIIYSTGFYNHKAKNIKKCAGVIVQKYGGRVPDDIAELVSLPGVGRKTANVVLSAAFGHQTIVVDTHVLRIAGRLGLTDKKDPVKAEYDLMKSVPQSSWNDLSLQLIYFGREICSARNPRCTECPLIEVCPADKNL